MQTTPHRLEAYRFDRSVADVLQERKGSPLLRTLVVHAQCVGNFRNTEFDRLQCSLQLDEVLAVRLSHGYYGTEQSFVLVKSHEEFDRLKRLDCDTVTVLEIFAVRMPALGILRATADRVHALWVDWTDPPVFH